MKLESFVTCWTHCYHVTAAVNLDLVRRLRTLLPAATLLRLAERDEVMKQRRTSDVRLRLNGLEVLIRNQIALDPASIEVGLDETFEGYVACLNERVFFWPGTTSSLTLDGMRMFQRTFGVKSVMIRVPSRSLFESNDGLAIHLSTCNTGKSSTENGKKSRRGRAVFQKIKSFTELPKRIEEISIVGRANLPNDSEYCDGVGETWRSLFEPGKSRCTETILDREPALQELPLRQSEDDP